MNITGTFIGRIDTAPGQATLSAELLAYFAEHPSKYPPPLGLVYQHATADLATLYLVSTPDDNDEDNPGKYTVDYFPVNRCVWQNGGLEAEGWSDEIDLIPFGNDEAAIRHVAADNRWSRDEFVGMFESADPLIRARAYALFAQHTALDCFCEEGEHWNREKMIRKFGPMIEQYLQP